jgi:hypothetical protein
MSNIDTREAAKKLREIADFLDSRPMFSLEYFNPGYFSFYDKAQFVAAAKAIWDATKSTKEGVAYADFRLTSKHAPITLSIARDKVCRKTVKYECEPLFTSEEMESL